MKAYICLGCDGLIRVICKKNKLYKDCGYLAWGKLKHSFIKEAEPAMKQLICIIEKAIKKGGN